MGHGRSPGEATVLLPTRDKPVELPKPVDEDIERMIQHEVRRLSGARHGRDFDT